MVYIIHRQGITYHVMSDGSEEEIGPMSPEEARAYAREVRSALISR